MKVIVFLFMLISSNLVFAGSEIYLPSELTICSSCIMKLPKSLTITEYCSKNKNKDKDICGGDANSEIYEEIKRLDSFSDCKVKVYNSVIDKFKKRNIKIIETDDKELVDTDDAIVTKYDSDETYKVTMCLTANYGKFNVYKSSKIEKTETKKVDVKTENIEKKKEYIDKEEEEESEE